MGGDEQIARGGVTPPPGAARRGAGALVRLANALASLAGILAIACLCALLLLVIGQTLAGMLSRTFPGVTSMLSVSWEYAGYLMGAAFMLGMAQTLRMGGHIRVSLLFDVLSPRSQRVADFVASGIALAMTATLAHALVRMALRSHATGSRSTASLTPLWIPEGVFAVAACLFAFQLFVRMVSLAVGLPPEEQKSYVGAPSE